jgi:hypothetical protein
LRAGGFEPADHARPTRQVSYIRTQLYKTSYTPIVRHRHSEAIRFS